VSRSGHPSGLLNPPLGAALVGRFALARGHRFAEHVHPTHQLAWAERGVLSISAGDTTWALPPTRALRIPADERGVEALARLAGTSPRTLHRLFHDDAGCGLREWRTRARIRAALQLLATGTPVGVVAGRVGPPHP
jgi:AraC-like DNA-binding protein